MIKCYVQNGYNKKVFMSPNYKQAAKKFLKSLVITNKNGDEIAELSPITSVSNYGYIGDILRSGNLDKIDDGLLFSTAVLFQDMGRKDIAKFIKSEEKKHPKEVQKVLKMMRA